MYRLALNNNWMLRGEGLHWGPEMLPAVMCRENGWMSADLPCDVHMPLIENNIIVEPLEADNCYKCEWIEQKSWWFKKVFTADERLLEADIAELTLESLDAEADIFLNGFHLGHHRSAFYAFTKDVGNYLNKGENTLIVRVSSGLERVTEMDIAEINKTIGTEAGNGRMDRGDKRRAFIRKPQYVYGWDWGPRVATCGIMKNVHIGAYDKLAVRGVHVVTKSAAKDAELGFEIEVENLHPFSSMDANLKLEIFLKEEKVAEFEQEVFLRSGINYFNIDAVISDAKLWWPNGMGAQSLYDIRVSAASGQICGEFPVFKYGIRTLKLDLDKINANERLFAFEVNGVKAFCKGANWIPADSVYARVTDEKYDVLIREAKEANFTMLRVWGGGIYERDIFYEKCDEYGIMIWHDFMFACAMYPDNLEWFRNEVENEINYQTKRLRNHSSIVLWSGNNENTWGFDEWWNTDKKAPLYGGAICYNEIAPRIVQNNCPGIPYWNSSPYGGEHPNGNEAGDRHHWHDCTMNPDMEKRIMPEEYDKVKSKFVSEYGYIGPCRKSSIIKYHGGASLDKDGMIWQHHNNTFEKKTVPAGIAKHYAEPDKLDIDEYLLYAGLCQGLMYGYSLEALRFKENCWGSLFWMYDDCWGEVGWTVIDYYLMRKPSFYYVKRAFAAKSLILREKDGLIKVMGVNDTAERVTFEAEYGYTTFDGKNKKCSKALIILEPYSRSIVLEFEKGWYDFTKGICYVMPVSGESDVLPATLRACEFRKLCISEAIVKVSDFRQDGNNVEFTVSSDAYAHAVHFGLDEEIHLSDEYFDLLPGENRRVKVYGYGATGRLNSEEIKPKSVYNKSIVKLSSM